MSAGARTPAASCRRWWSKEGTYARKLTSRAERREARAWLRLALVTDPTTPAPVLPGTQGRITH